MSKKPDFKWAEVAQDAEERLAERFSHGDRLKRMEEIASELGVSRGTLNNQMRAARVLPRVLELLPDIEEKQIALTPKAVLSLDRWARLDVEDARKFLKETDKTSDAAILKGEKEAKRLSLEQGEGGRSLYEQFTLQWFDLSDPEPGGRRADSFFSSLFPHLAYWLPADVFLRLDDVVSVTAVEDTFLRAFGVSLVGVEREDGVFFDRRSGEMQNWSDLVERRGHPWVDNDRSDRTTAFGVMEMTKSALGEIVRKEARSVFARAVVAATQLPLVILICRNLGDYLEFLRGLPDMPEGMEDVELEEQIFRLLKDQVGIPTHYWDQQGATPIIYPTIYQPTPSHGRIVLLMPPEEAKEFLRGDLCARP